MTKSNQINGDLFVLGWNYNTPYYQSRKAILRAQAPMTNLIKNDRDKKMQVILYKLVPVKTMNSDEYIEEVKNKTLYSVEEQNV